jgi:hypothetical protein
MRKAGVPSILVAVAVLAVGVIAEAQQPKKVPLIGFLGGPSLVSTKPLADTFRQGLRELGYVEGQSLAIEWRSAEGVNERLPNLAAELVKLKVVSSLPVALQQLKLRRMPPKQSHRHDRR